MEKASRKGKHILERSRNFKKICTSFILVGEVFSREVRQNSRRGSGASRFPESLIEEVPLGESAPHTLGSSQ